jgi:hypothetical protein
MATSFGRATEKQVRYLMYLLDRKGFDTRWMSSEYKELSATCRERSGSVENWLCSRTIGEASSLIRQLQEMEDSE